MILDQIPTIAHHPPGHFPQDKSKSPNIDSLVRIKAIHLDGFIQNFRGHVAFGAHSWVVPHVELIGALGMHDGQACKEEDKSVKQRISLLREPLQNFKPTPITSTLLWTPVMVALHSGESLECPL